MSLGRHGGGYGLSHYMTGHGHGLVHFYALWYYLLFGGGFAGHHHHHHLLSQLSGLDLLVACLTIPARGGGVAGAATWHFPCSMARRKRRRQAGGGVSSILPGSRCLMVGCLHATTCMCVPGGSYLFLGQDIVYTILPPPPLLYL